MFTEFSNKMKKLYEKTNGKKVIIWGWGRSGQFLYSRFLADNKNVDCIIDEKFCCINLNIKNHYVLEYYNPKITLILVSCYNEMEQIKDLILNYGFKEENIIFVREHFYGSSAKYEIDYYQWLEYFYGLEISEYKSIEAHGYINEKKDFNIYGYGKGYPLELILRKFSFNSNDSVFDFGCGKGASLIMFKNAGINILGGVEYDKEIYKQALINMKILGIENNIICGNASECKEVIDEYNYYYMYDPFIGEVFQKVINNIEESFVRKPRKIILIYSAPRCHTSVIKNGRFQFVNHYENIHTITRTTNIYVLE